MCPVCYLECQPCAQPFASVGIRVAKTNTAVRLIGAWKEFSHILDALLRLREVFKKLL